MAQGNPQTDVQTSVGTVKAEEVQVNSFNTIEVVGNPEVLVDVALVVLRKIELEDTTTERIVEGAFEGNRVLVVLSTVTIR